MTLAFIFIMHFSRPEIEDIIRQEAVDAKVPQCIALRLAYNESEYYPLAIGHNKKFNPETGEHEITSSDIGLFQLNDKYIKFYIKRFYPEGSHEMEINLGDPRINAKIGLRYLRALYDLLGNWEDAVMAYNCGIGTVIYGCIPEKTISYMWRIIADFGQREKWEYGISL